MGIKSDKWIRRMALEEKMIEPFEELRVFEFFQDVVIGKIAPFAEEALFRGYVFRQLYRRARWGFWLAALVPSVLFALVHVYQAEGLWELVGIMAITGLGSEIGRASCRERVYVLV